MLVTWAIVFWLTTASPARAGQKAILAETILADQDLHDVLQMARATLTNGFNAGDGYGQVWIRDLNTFIELSLEGNDSSVVKANLLKFFDFQGAGGDIPDGYQVNDGSYVTNKNTVEIDQESSLVQAIHKYTRATGDTSVLTNMFAGKTVLERMELALGFLLNNRYSSQYGLVWSATRADWGDIQPEDFPGVTLNENSHKAICIYDNAMFLIAVTDYLSFVRHDPVRFARWNKVRASVIRNSRKYLWDRAKQKYIPHLYLDGSPFPADFAENDIYYHGGTAVAIEAGLLSRKEIRGSLATMVQDVQSAGAGSIGLSQYPCYPLGLFVNEVISPYNYQDGGDWTWWGGRMIQQLIRYGYVAEAYREIKPMVARAKRDDGFYEWYDVNNQPMGSGSYRGAAGVLGKAIEMLLDWAEAHSKGAGRR